GLTDAELEPLLVALVRKEILSIQADPRSPERGQYSFLQDIVKHVAYETISKKERKTKHLAAAQFLSSVWSAEEDEIVEVVAAHPAARVSAKQAEIPWEKGRIEQGLENMERAFEVLSTEEPDADLASLAAQLGRFLFFRGQADLALERIETALGIAEALGVP